jgi:hypothetical protein
LWNKGQPKLFTKPVSEPDETHPTQKTNAQTTSTMVNVKANVKQRRMNLERSSVFSRTSAQKASNFVPELVHLPK